MTDTRTNPPKILGVAVFVECPHKRRPGGGVYLDPRTGECAQCQGDDVILRRMTLAEFAALFTWGETHHDSAGYGAGPSVTHDIRVKDQQT